MTPRFSIAQEVADSKEKHDARSLFHRASEVAGKIPHLVITDGLPAYRDAARKEYQTNHGHSGAVHVADIALKGVIHNNKMERMNGEVRDREKVMRGLKKMDSPIFKGLQIYHNFKPELLNVSSRLTIRKNSEEIQMAHQVNRTDSDSTFIPTSQ